MQRKPSKPEEHGQHVKQDSKGAGAPAMDASIRQMTAMVSSIVEQRPDLLERVGKQMNVPAEQLAAQLKAAESGTIPDIPSDVVEKMQQSMGAANPMSLPIYEEYKDEASDLFEEEKSQGILTLYRGSFLAYSDLAFGPVFN